MAVSLLWLVTLTLPDGTIIRAATRPKGVSQWSYDTLLLEEPVFDEELNLFSLDAVAGFQQATVSLVTHEDLAAKAADWRHIVAARAELALIIGSASYDDRRVLIRNGRIHNLQLGLKGERTSFTVESVASPTSTAVGADTQDMGDEWVDPLTDTAAGAMSSLVGRKRVYVFGDPKRVPAYKVGAVSGNDRLVLCGHSLPDTGSVTVYEDDGSGISATPVNTTNSAGAYAYNDSSSIYRAADGAYTWDADRGGISAADDLASPALRASGVLRKLLAMSGERIDWRSMEDTLRSLHRYQCGFWVDEEVAALDLIRSRMVPVFPLVEVMGPNGLYFAISDPHERAPVVSLVEGQQLIGRASGLEFSDADAVRNQFTLNYAYNAQSGVYEKSATIDKDNDPLCYLSHQIYSETLADKTLKTACVHDEATAYAVLRARASRLALQRRRVAFYAATDVMDYLRAGMVVLLTSSSWGMTSERAVVQSISYREAALMIQFDVLDRTFNSRR